MVIYVLNARLECLTNFTIFRFRWFNNWFPYFWINWLGYGLTLGYLLFISIFFLDFSVLQFSAAESAWKAKESEKNTSALGEWPGEPENQYPPSGRISIHPRSADTLSLLPHFSHALAALSLALAALSLSAAAFDVLPCDIYNVSLQLGYQFAASEESIGEGDAATNLFLHCFFAGKLLWAPKTLFWFGILSCWAFPTVIC